MSDMSFRPQGEIFSFLDGSSERFLASLEMTKKKFATDFLLCASALNSLNGKNWISYAIKSIRHLKQWFEVNQARQVCGSGPARAGKIDKTKPFLV